MKPNTPNETRLQIRVSDRDKATLQKAAAARNLSLSAYVRMVILEDAKRVIAKERVGK